jgi:ribosomal protein L7/L12
MNSTSWIVIALAVVGLVWLLRRRRPSDDLFPSNRPPTEEQIDALLRQGHKIEAIRGYRLLHNVDLKTAKDAIEARQRTLRGGPEPTA